MGKSGYENYAKLNNPFRQIIVEVLVNVDVINKVLRTASLSCKRRFKPKLNNACFP